MEQNNSTFKAFRVEEKEGNYIGSVRGMEFRPLSENEILKMHCQLQEIKE